MGSMMRYYEMRQEIMYEKDEERNEICYIYMRRGKGALVEDEHMRMTMNECN